MKKPKKLTPKQQMFCHEYLIDLNATQAAIRAGYSKNGAKVTAFKLLAMDHITEEINKLKNKRVERVEITADQVLQELATLAFADITNIADINAGGVTIKELANVDELHRRAIVEITETPTKSGANKLAIRLGDKLGALNALGKHLGIFEKDNKIKIEGELSIVDLIKKAQKDSE